MNGTVRRAAHDDLVLIAHAGVPPLTLNLPDCNIAKWKRKTVLSLATNATATAIVSTHATRGKLRIVKSVVDAWVASTVDSDRPTLVVCQGLGLRGRSRCAVSVTCVW